MKNIKKRTLSGLVCISILSGFVGGIPAGAEIDLTSKRVWQEDFKQETSSGYPGWQGYKDESVLSAADENGNCGLTFTSNGRNDDWGFFAHSFDKKYDSGTITISMDVTLDAGAELWIGMLSHITLLGGHNQYSEALRKLLTTDEEWGWGISHQLKNGGNKFTVHNAEVSQIFSTWPAKLIQRSDEELSVSYNQSGGDYPYLIFGGGIVGEKSFSGGKTHKVTIVGDCSNSKVQTYIDGVALYDTPQDNKASYIGLNFMFVSNTENSGAKAVIDNMLVYTVDETAEAPTVIGVDFPEAEGEEIGPKIKINFSDEMYKNVTELMTLECNGEPVDVKPELSEDGKSGIISGGINSGGNYRLVVKEGSVGIHSGKPLTPYSLEFECGEGENGKVNFIPKVLGATAIMLDGTEKSDFNMLSPYVNRFEIKFATEMREDVGEYIFASEGLEFEGELSADKKTYGMKFKNLAPESQYKVTVKGGAPSVDGVGIKADSDFIITTSESESELKISKPVVTVDGAEVDSLPPAKSAAKANVEFMKIGGDETKAGVMVCQWSTDEDGYKKLEAVKMNSVNIKNEIGRKTAEVEFEIENETDSIGIYVLSYPENQIISKTVIK